MNTNQDNKDDKISKKRQPNIKLTLLFGFFLPYLARLPGIPWHGSRWLWDYVALGEDFVSSVESFVLFGLFNAIPLVVLLVLFFIGRDSQKSIIPFWVATILTYISLFIMHAILDLTAGSTAGVALISIPIIAAPVALIGWGLGWGFELIIGKIAGATSIIKEMPKIKKLTMTPGIKLTFLFGIFLPYIAKLISIPWHGSQWFWDYLPLEEGLFSPVESFILLSVFDSALSLVALLVLYFISKDYQKSMTPFWGATILMYVYLFFMHATVDLTTDALPSVADVFFPLIAVPVALIGWGLGITYNSFRTFKK